MTLNHDCLSPTNKHQANVPQTDRTVTTSNELDLLFSLMFDELLNGSSKVVSKSFAVSATDDPLQRQNHTTPLNIHTTPAPTCQAPTLEPSVTSSENINQAKMYAENDQVADDEFINIFSTPVQDQGETSSRHVDSSNMHTFYQRYPSEHRWTKDHPLEQVIRNPSQSVRTRRQLESDAEMCMFALTVSQTEPKNIKEAIANSAWIESMQEELHQFDRLDQAPRAWYDELSKFLTSKGFTKGLPIHQSPRGIFINQAKYTLEILHKHGMDKGQSIGTPMATKPKLDADLSGNTVDQTDYHIKIGSLMYLTSSRPNIVQVVCFCVRYQSRPTEKHLKEVKRIFRYLRGTVHMGLWYPKDSSFELTTFSNADHVGCIDSRKSTSGGIQFLGDKLVSWMSKKHNCTAMSSAEAEYVALFVSRAQVMWMRTQLQDYVFNYNKIPLYCDCQTEYQLADMFTKALPKDRFKYLVRRIGYEMFDSSRTGDSGKRICLI
nr:retrovirus-related Pol polyprotein from transposon TNT 1-94 [Tanacetum cinerariifolium]